MLRSANLGNHSVPAGDAPHPSRNEAADQGQHGNPHLESSVRRDAAAFHRGPRHVADGDAARVLSLCGHPLVFDDLRSRRADHRAAMLVARSANPPRRVAAPGGDAGGQVRCGIGCRARQDPARDPRGRDGQAQRDPVRPLLRQRGFNSAVRAACRSVRADERRSRDAERALAGDATRVGLDRRPGRSGSGRLRRIFPSQRKGAGQPRLEGFARRHLSCRWAIGARADRARRGARLCLCGQDPCSAMRRATRACRSSAWASRAGRSPCGSLRAILLVRGARQLRNGARRREEPLSRAQLQCRPGPVQRDRAAGSGRNASRRG